MFGVYMEALGAVWMLWGVSEVWEHTQKAPPGIPSTPGSDITGMSGCKEGEFCGGQS